MELDTKKLKRLTKFMRSQGILKLKQGDIEIILSKQAIFPKKPAAAPTPAQEKQNALDLEQATLERLLWSSPIANLIPKAVG